MRRIIRTIEGLHRLAVRIAVALETDPRAACPGCVIADRNLDKHRFSRAYRRPASKPVRLSNGAVVLCCIAHAPFVEHYRMINPQGRIVR